jgi:hypothetical protein
LSVEAPALKQKKVMASILLPNCGQEETISTTTLRDLASTQVLSESVLQDDIQPDGGYGWVCVACCFFINGFTWGIVAVGTAFR